MNALIGTNANLSYGGPCRVKSVTVTPRDAAIDTLEIRRYSDANAVSVYKIKASNGMTIQTLFEGLVFSGGVLVVPSATCEGFIVEYEPT